MTQFSPSADFQESASLDPGIDRPTVNGTEPSALSTSGSKGTSEPNPNKALRDSLRRHDLLVPLLRAQVIAAAVQNVEIPEDETSRAVASYRQRFNLTSDEALRQHLSQILMKKEDLLWKLQLPLRIRKHSRDQFEHRSAARFLERKHGLDQVVYSLVRAPSQGLAHEYYLRLVDGETDFATLSAELANGPEQYTLGLIGPVPLNQGHPQLAERLRITAAGQLVPPFQVENWWLVARVERHIQASLDDVTRERMCRELFDEWVNDSLRKQLVGNQSAITPAT